jgi:hypothetical protein
MANSHPERARWQRDFLSISGLLVARRPIMSELVLPVGLAHKLETAFNRNRYTLGEVDKLCEGDKLAQFRKVLLGHAVITVHEHLIDLDADPFVPNRWKVEEHRKGGQFKWDASKVSLYLSKKQQRGVIEGNKLRDELKGKPVYNANLLDYLLKNPHLIPEEWKDKYVFLWGTVYRDSGGNLCVRYLYWSGDGWGWGSDWLDSDWGDGRPAAVPAR